MIRRVECVCRINIDRQEIRRSTVNKSFNN